MNIVGAGKIMEIFGLNRREDILKTFWDKKALKYPSPFDEKVLKSTNNIIHLLVKKGVDFENKFVLDIGCGTGLYTLPIALRASHVIGIDISDAMLDKLKSECLLHKIDNVSVVKSLWQDIDVESSGYKKAFDIVFSAMTPAIKEREDIIKMEQCSKNWCVYIGWGRLRKNKLMEEVFNLHGLQYGPPAGVKKTCAYLESMGRSYSLEFVNDSWDWEGSEAEALEDMSGYISMHGAIPRMNVIKELLSAYSENGLIKHTTIVEIGVVVWHV